MVLCAVDGKHSSPPTEGGGINVLGRECPLDTQQLTTIVTLGGMAHEKCRVERVEVGWLSVISGPGRVPSLLLPIRVVP